MAFDAPAGTIRARGFDWDEVKYPARLVSDFAKLCYGKSLVESKRRPGSVPMYGTNGQCGWHDMPLASGPGVILGRKGQGHLGVKWCDVPFWVIDTAYYAEVNSAEVDLKWFYYVTHYVGLDHLKTGEKPGLSRDVFGRLLFPFPTRDEQKNIARILGTLDDKIELNRRMNQTLEGLARAIFQSWFVDFDPVTAKAAGRQPLGMSAETALLFPDSFEDSPLGPIPKGWRVATVRQLCSRIENGGTPRRDAPGYWVPATIPWLTSAEVRQGIVIATESFISKEGFDNSSAKMWPALSTVVALYGATAGQVCLIATDLCANQACCGLVPAANADFYLYLRVASFVEELEQSTRGSAQQNLSQQIVADLPAVIPNNPLFTAFENSIKPIVARCIANLKQSRTLAALRDTLLPRLLSGELRVAAAEKVLP